MAITCLSTLAQCAASSFYFVHAVVHTVRILQHLLYDEDSSRSRLLLRSAIAMRGRSDGWWWYKYDMNTRTPGIQAEK